MDDSRFRRGLLTRALVALATAATIAAAAHAEPTEATEAAEPAGLDPVWTARMVAGLDAWDQGDLEAAGYHFRLAVARARAGLPDEELGVSLYRLGDVIRVRPGLSRGESALDLLEEARRHLARAYGPDHPVLLPVWARIALLQSRAGRVAEAEASRAAADAIALRFFPEHHFLRERFGAARAAQVVHPLEVLHLLAGEAGSPEPAGHGGLARER